MKHIPFQNRHASQNSDTCTAFEYPLSEHEIDMAVVEIKGRYPDSGRAVNTVAKEIALVIEGSGKISIENTDISLSKGDVVYIEPNERIFWEGNLTLAISCTPAWSKDQYEYVD